MKNGQIFMLHYAGGSCYSFRFLEPSCHDLEMIPLELPGRGKRTSQRLLNNFDEAALDLAGRIREYLPLPGFILYGHSMGALLALRAARLLEEMGIPPGYLIVSGNPGPGIKEVTTRYLLGKEEFKQELSKLGGMPSEIYENEELFDFFEPILRKDFEIAETGNLQPFNQVNCPIYAIMGTDEEYAADISNWKGFTRARFDSQLMEGTHFFIYRHDKAIAEIFRKCRACPNISSSLYLTSK